MGTSAARRDDLGTVVPVEAPALLVDHQLEDWLDHADAVAYTKDLDGRYLFVNGAHERAFGRSRLDVVGRLDAELFGPEVAEHLRRNDAAVLAQGGPVVSEERVVDLHGRARIYRSTKFPVRDDTGRVYAIGGLSTDVTDVAEAHDQARERNALLDAVLDSLRDGVIACGPQGELLMHNRAMGRFNPDGVIPDVPMGERAAAFHLYRPDGVTPLPPEEDPVRRVLDSGRLDRAELVFAPPGLPPRTLVVNGRAMRDGDGAVSGAVVSFRDVTTRLAAERGLAESEQLFRTAFHHSPAGMSISADGVFLTVNPALCRMLGRDEPSLVGRTMVDITHPDDVELSRRALDGLLEGGPAAVVEKRYLRPDGHVVWARTGVSRLSDAAGRCMMLVQVEDISERKAAEEVLRDQARLDPLTGLPNRRLLHERVAVALERLGDSTAALMFVDLDGFKQVNDEHGHEVGDVLLTEVGRRLQAQLRGDDVLARLGGDEFVVLCERLPAADAPREALAVAERLVACLVDPVDVGPAAVLVTASVGVATAGAADVRTGLDARGLLRRADAAMYDAKRQGKGRCAPYVEQRRGPVTQEARLEKLLRTSIADGTVLVHYQPVVDLHTGTVVGCEALSRLATPEGDLVPPDRFIELAERRGLIGPLGEQVRRRAVVDTVRWKAELPADQPFCVGVNLSVRELRRPGLVERLGRMVDDAGLPRDALIVELTESLFMDEAGGYQPLLEDLSALGVQLSVDDFGTGCSALSYLRRFPVDNIKIDRSFVADIEREPRSAAVTAAIVHLASELGIHVVAEGVETAAQRALLRSYGCGLAQGYLFSRPVPAEQFGALLRATLPLPAPVPGPRADLAVATTVD